MGWQARRRVPMWPCLPQCGHAFHLPASPPPAAPQPPASACVPGCPLRAVAGPPPSPLPPPQPTALLLRLAAERPGVSSRLPAAAVGPPRLSALWRGQRLFPGRWRRVVVCSWAWGASFLAVGGDRRDCKKNSGGWVPGHLIEATDKTEKSDRRNKTNRARR